MNLSSVPTLALAENDAVLRDSVVQALKDDFKVVALPLGIGKTALLADLIIYDLKRGIRDLRSLRERYPQMPIVLIATKAATAMLNEALEVEKTDFITKPIDSNELKIRITQCLRKWRIFESHIVKQAKSEGMVPNRLGRASSIGVPLPELHSASG